MKKTILISSLLFFVFSNLTAQENIVRINPFGLGFKSLTLGYERVLKERQSVAVDLNFQLGTPGFINRFVENEISTQEGSGAVRLSGFAITPQYKLYVSRKGAPRGFYFSPYLRYTSRKLDIMANYDDEPTDLVITLSSPGIGFQMGAQWIIADKVSIDWHFLGIGMNYTTFKAVFTNTSIGDIEQDIVDELDNLPYIRRKIGIDTEENSLTAKVGFTFPALRSGFSVGYFF